MIMCCGTTSSRQETRGNPLTPHVPVLWDDTKRRQALYLLTSGGSELPPPVCPQLDDIKMQLDEKGSGNSDSSPLIRTKQAIRNLEHEVSGRGNG